MTLRVALSGLRTRILLSAVIGALVVVGPVMLFMLGRFGKAHINAQLSQESFLSEPERRACLEHPTTFHPVRNNVAIHAYDRSTLRSRNPAAPALEGRLVERLQRGEKAPWIHIPHHRGTILGVALQQVGERGPCSLLRIELLRLPTISQRLKNAWIAGTTVALALAMVIAMFVAIRPLVRRLRTLRGAAELVGGPRYAPSPDDHGDDIAAIAAALDDAHRRIEANTRELTEQREILAEHLAHVAHDLRTPLASLQLALESTLGRTTPAVDQANAAPARQEALERAWNDALYLSALVENLHLASRLRGGADPGDPRARVDLSQIVDQVGRRFAALGAMRSVEVSWAGPDEPLWARCDPAMAQQAFANLVHNAVTHGDADGHVAVLLEREGERFRLRVIDDGPGVAPERLPTLNEPTFRSDAARRRDPRAGGLGVAITHEICRRAGWSLAFREADPRGLEAEIVGDVTEIS